MEYHQNSDADDIEYEDSKTESMIGAEDTSETVKPTELTSIVPNINEAPCRLFNTTFNTNRTRTNYETVELCRDYEANNKGIKVNDHSTEIPKVQAD